MQLHVTIGTEISACQNLRFQCVQVVTRFSRVNRDLHANIPRDFDLSLPHHFQQFSDAPRKELGHKTKVWGLLHSAKKEHDPRMSLRKRRQGVIELGRE